MKTLHQTFKKGRRCRKCGAPIPDQIHGGQHHCLDIHYEDGTVKSCKKEHDAERKKAKLALHREVNRLQEKMRASIERLFKKVGPAVTPEQLDLFDVRLDYALRHERKGDGYFNFYFTGFRLEQLSLTQLKIHRHEQALLQRRLLARALPRRRADRKGQSRCFRRRPAVHPCRHGVRCGCSDFPLASQKSKRWPALAA